MAVVIERRTQGGFIATIEGGNPGSPIAGVTLSWPWKDGIIMQFYTGHQLERSLVSVRERAANVNYKVFGLNPLWIADETDFHLPTPEELIKRRRLREPRDMRDNAIARSVTFAVTAESRDIGMVIQNVVPVHLPDGSEELVAWTGLRAVEKQSQGQGIGTEILRRSVRALMYFKPGIGRVMGRSQNDLVFLTLEKTALFGHVAPIDGDFTEEESYVLDQVAPQTLHPVPVDRRTGLARKQYQEGKTGGSDEEPNLADPQIERIDNRLVVDIGLKRERGDAVYYEAPIKTVLEARRKLGRSIFGRRIS